MRDHTYDAECEAMRDRLPELLHGRRDPAEGDRVERHVAECGACTLELATLRDARAAMAASAPAVDVEAVVAAVRAATVPRRPAHPGVARRGAALAPRRVAAPGRWRVRPRVAAFVASVLVAAGAGALWRTSGAPLSGDAGAVASGSPAAVVRPVTTIAPTGAPIRVASAEPALGERFDDLSDEELQAVVAAVEASERGLPTVEPDADVLAGEVEGG